MAGLVPAIHVFAARKEDVDARDEPGHDGSFGRLRRGAKSCSQSVAMLRNAFASLLLCALLAASLVRAEDYPVRPIMLVVPYPPGGGNDVIARIVAAKMSAALGRE